MHKRFSQYLRLKGVSYRSLAELSCVSLSSISRFCTGTPISSDKLLKLLQCCDDLSLEWLFYGSGDMLRAGKNNMYNVGAFAGSEISSGDSVFVKNASGVHVERGESRTLLELIAEKDRIISERDATITELHRLLALK